MKRTKQQQRWHFLGLGTLLVLLITIVFWQTSLSFGEFRPSDFQQTLLLWSISTVVFLGMVTLGFMLFRDMVKLYIERRAGQLGSKIKTKLVAGALALTILPVVFLFFFSFNVLNRTLDKWFSQPIEQLQKNFREVIRQAAQDKAETLAEWLASMPQVRGPASPEDLARSVEQFASAQQLPYAAVIAGGTVRAEYASDPRLKNAWRAPASPPDDLAIAARAIPGGQVVAGWRALAGLSSHQAAIAAQYRWYQEQYRYWKFMRYFYVGMLSLITLFILFVATWIALFLSKQIVAPLEALAKATAQVSKGRLDYRIETRAIDELAMLVRSFNQMTEQLEHSREELDARRRFTEAILENIPTGVISLSPEGEIQRVNPALGRIFPAERAATARRLEDLFTGEAALEVRRLLRRARRTGLASGPLDFASGGQTQHLAVTVSMLEPEASPGCVVVIEDTSELLRAQKSAAWQEVAQRVAHEIKNPLTPIALSAERMSRLVERHGSQQDVRARLDLDRLLHSCTATITREVKTLQTLVDEFSQFARFPRAQPEPWDLNEVVESALEASNGRLDGLTVRRELAPELPPVSVDPEQLRRAVVNLIDNAVEAMRGDAGGVLTVSTALGAAADTVELAVADSGHGIAPEDREKMFLPYFSTRKRGTGLGLAIVSRIVTEHKGSIRVEDNRPRGARFIVEIPTAEVRSQESEVRIQESEVSSEASRLRHSDF